MLRKCLTRVQKRCSGGGQGETRDTRGTFHFWEIVFPAAPQINPFIENIVGACPFILYPLYLLNHIQGCIEEDHTHSI